MLFRQDILERHRLRPRDARLPRWRKAPPAAGSTLRTSASAIPWTSAYLNLIADRPAVVSHRLAPLVGEADLARFKRRVRQLKELGLTESLEVGYRLSPRGAAVLSSLS